MAGEEAKYAYLAGIIDGEGCVSLQSFPQSDFLRPCLIIGQKNYQFLADLCIEHPGGRITRSSTGWNLQYTKASVIESVLLSVLPYLRIKKSVAEVVILVCRVSGKVGGHYSDKERLMRARLEEEYFKRLEERKRSALVAPEGMTLQ